MYNIHDVIPYNCKDVVVKTVSGHTCVGRCHVYSELDDDYDKFINYVVIGTSSCIDLEDIAEITEIND